MSEKISIMIVDDNKDFLNMLTNFFVKQEGIEVVGSASDGIDAIEGIKALQPDLVILDMVLPGVDGIGVLEYLSGSSHIKKPAIIFLSAVGKDEQIHRALSLGADYYMLKPCDLNILLLRIKDIYNQKYSLKKSVDFRINNDKIEEDLGKILETETSKLLHKAGIPPHISGFHYLREAIIYYFNHSNQFLSITKVLYPEMAKLFNSTPQKVERSIRNAIDTSWSRAKNGVAVQNGYYGYFANLQTKPTNSEFIAAMSEQLKVEMVYK